jgi:putative ABC transport system permease protein
MSLFSDLRFALRLYRRRPGFTAAALLALTLGLGGAIAIGSVADALLFRPLPFPAPAELALILEESPSRGFSGMPSSPGNFADYVREARAFRHLAAVRNAPVVLEADGEPVRLAAAKVSGSFFEVLGVRPALGRSFRAVPGGGGESGVAVLGHALWQSRFGGDPRIVGRSLALDGRRYTVVGVLPPGVAYPGDAEVWLPFELDGEGWADRQGHYLRLIGRLAPGETLPRAQAEMDVLSSRLAARHAENEGCRSLLVRAADRAAEPVRPAVLGLLGAAGLLLAVATTNFANLLLAQALGRRQEAAVRTALGARRGTAVRQGLVESTVLALAGGGLGLGLAALAARLFGRPVAELAGSLRPAGIDLGIAAAGLALALASGFAAGALPAWNAAWRAPALLLAGGRGVSAEWRHPRAPFLLAAAQLALAFVLLVGAALFLRSLDRLLAVDPGFAPRGVLTFRVELPASSYPEGAQRAAFFEQLARRLRALPGVTSAGAASSLPLAGSTDLVPFSTRGEATGSVPFSAVLPGYFESLRVPLRAGRFLSRSDDGARPAALLASESFARRYFPRGAIGGRLSLGSGADARLAEIVGVVGDVRAGGLEAPGEATLYGPYGDAPFQALTFALRTAGDPALLAPAARRAVAAADPHRPVDSMATLEGTVRGSLGKQRLAAGAFGLFAGVALLTAATGVYGLLSQLVSRSRREIAVRLALGAGRRHALGLLGGFAARLVVAGLAAGGVGAFAAGGLLASRLYGVGRADAASYAAAALLLAAVVAAAAWGPARRAARVDPARELGGG